MLLTLTTTGTGDAPATDLGYLLHKHPGRMRRFGVPAGSAHVFYPVAGPDECTAALVVEASSSGHVDDGAYAAGSQLAVALSSVFRTAMSGRCPARPDLAAAALPLTVRVPTLTCGGGPDLVRRLFAPLGWEVGSRAVPLDPELDGWGDSRYVDTTLRGELRVADALTHPYVLLPVCAGAKHYRVGSDEVDTPGLPERYHGRASGKVRSFALYGDTTGESDEFGLPVRYPWAKDYRGAATVVYGHTPVPETEWVNNTLCLDTGAVFGGSLTALRHPEREIVSVPAEKVWSEPVRPLRQAEPDRAPDVLDLGDVTGTRRLVTAHHGTLTVRAEQSAAALEVMSRFAVDPRRLVYLPPTMAPVSTSSREGLLEHPAEAFAGYRDAGVARVVCQEKHMGSRAVVHLAREPDGSESVVTRTGRPFLDPEPTTRLLSSLRAAATAAGLWDELDAGRLLLDCELLPWSAKAGGLIREHFASVGAAGQEGLAAALDAVRAAAARGVDTDGLDDRLVGRAERMARYRDAYRRYCWPTDGLDGVTIAPFQLLAAGGTTFHDRPHDWHLALADRLHDGAPDLVRRTGRLVVDTTDETSTAAGAAWWEELTAAGGEGMVVKPLANLVRGPHGLVQPGLKVRGREYLRIIYGPDYTEPEHLARLRERRLGRKRSLALREYALGLEGLERFARGEPLWRVHECVFAVLALESDPVDPRL